MKIKYLLFEKGTGAEEMLSVPSCIFNPDNFSKHKFVQDIINFFVRIHPLCYLVFLLKSNYRVDCCMFPKQCTSQVYGII